MGDNDFVLSVGADLSNFQKSIDSVFKNYANKTLNIDVKARLDPNLKKVLSTVQNSKGKGGSSSTNSLISEERRAAKAANVLSVALQSASRNVDLFSLKMTKASHVKVPMGVAGGVVPAQKGVFGTALSGIERSLLVLPGISQLAGYARQAVGNLAGFGKGAMSAYDNQVIAETQLRQVLKNSGMGESAFNDIKGHAGAIQGRTTIGDEAMLAGAGELATYVKDPQQMKRMMDLLSNYAIGMNAGNPEVSQQQMVEYATGLGKAFDGTFDSMRKKGFDTSELEALSKLEKEGTKVTESQKIAALERALKDWDGLAEKIAQTDKGKLVQLQNTIGDLKENVGEKLYPAVGKLADTIKKNLPSLEKLFNALGKFLTAVVEQLAAHADTIAFVGDALSSLISTIADNLMPSVAGLGSAMTVLALSTSEATAGIIENAASMASNGGLMTSAIDSLGGVIGGIVKAGLIGILAFEIGILGKSVLDTIDQIREEKKMKKRAKEVNNSNQAVINSYAAWKDARDDYLDDPSDPERIASFRRATGAHIETLDAAKRMGLDFSGSEYDIVGKAEKNEAARAKKSAQTSAKTSTTNITQNIKVSTDFDSLGKLIKENLREIAISRMTFKTSAESAKAMAV